MGKQIVLLRWRDRGDRSSPEDVTVHAILSDRDELAKRLKQIQSKNHWPLRELGPNDWIIGPDYDVGFFGDKPMRLRAVEK